eukprot:3235909-Lingulodinium_polyedra.AAC.1
MARSPPHVPAGEEPRSRSAGAALAARPPKAGAAAEGQGVLRAARPDHGAVPHRRVPGAGPPT